MQVPQADLVDQVVQSFNVGVLSGNVVCLFFSSTCSVVAKGSIIFQHSGTSKEGLLWQGKTSGGRDVPSKWKY